MWLCHLCYRCKWEGEDVQLEAGGHLLGHGHYVSWSRLSRQIVALRVLVYLTVVLRSERIERSLWSARSWLSRFLLNVSSGDRTSHEGDREWRKQGRKQFLTHFPALTVPFCRDVSNSLLVCFSKLWTSQMPVVVSFTLPFRLLVCFTTDVNKLVACLVYIATSERLQFLKFYSLYSNSL